jgi:hypothetical protein
VSFGDVTNWRRPVRGVSATRHPARDVGRFVEYGNDHRRSRGAVGNPITACLDPGATAPCDLWVRPGCGESNGRLAFYLTLGGVQRGKKCTDRSRPPEVLVMLNEGADLAYGPGGIFDQPRGGVVPRGASSGAASRRARLSRSICRTTSLGTVSPAASSASLSSRISSHPAGADEGFPASSMMREYAHSIGCSSPISRPTHPYPRAASATPASVSPSATTCRCPRGSPSTRVPPSTPTIGETSTVVAAIEAGTSRRARNHAR